MITLDFSSISTVPPPEPTPSRPRELLAPLSDDNYLLVLDNTAAERFTTCPKSAEYYLVHKREAHAKNAALTFGGAIHAGLETLLKGKLTIERTTFGPAADHLEDEDAFSLRIARSILDYFTAHPTALDEYRTPTIALEVMAHYRQRARLPDYEWSVLSDDNGLLVERAFELPLGVLEVNAEISLPGKPPFFVKEIHVAWSGKIDVVANANGCNRIVDHKTTSMGGDQFVQDFQLSNQTIGYTWAARQLWPELNISGFCGNAIFLKRPASGTFPAGGLLSSGSRGGKPPLDFFRFYFEYSPERIIEWHQNIMFVMEDFVTCLIRGVFTMHTKYCFGKFGRCQYHDVCSLDDPKVRMNMLHTDMFRDVTWNPTHKG